MSASIHPALLQARKQQQSAKQSKMSITQTFYLAHKARGKLSSEAAKSDHNLRLLVGHANLLDSLMLNLQHAEREQDAWFNNMVRGNSMEEEDADVMDTISEEEENFGSLAEDYPSSESSDEESDDDYELDSEYLGSVPRPTAYDYRKTVIDVDEVEADSDFEEEEDGFYALKRTSSHAPMSPPELIEDDDSDSESNPPSPPQPTLAEPLFYEPKNKKQSSKSSFYDSNSPAGLEESSYYQSSNLIRAF